MVEINADYVQRNDRALAAHAAGSRFLVVVTGRRGGKTVFAPREAIKRIYLDDWPKVASQPYNPGAARGTSEWWRRKPRLHYWACAPTFDLVKEMRANFGQCVPPELVEYQNSHEGFWWLKPDILIEFKSTHDHENLRSRGLNGVLLDEAAFMHPQAWVGALRPSLSDKRGWLIATSTPMGRNWLWAELVAKALEGTPDYSFHTWTTAENTNVEGLAEEVEFARRTLPTEYFRREYEASFDAFQGQIFHEWDDDRYSVSLDRVREISNLQFRRVLGGADWGFGNPGCLGVVGFSKLFTFRLDEVYQRSELVEDFWLPQATKLQNEYKFAEWCCDPAEPDNITRFQRGLPRGTSVFRHTNHGAGKFDEHARSVLSGIRQMASTIHQGRLYCVKERCKDFRAEMRDYKWEEVPATVAAKVASSERMFQERPAPHQKCHAIDTQRYCMTFDGRPAALAA